MAETGVPFHLTIVEEAAAAPEGALGIPLSNPTPGYHAGQPRFPGASLVLVGDTFQLPPRTETKEHGFSAQQRMMNGAVMDDQEDVLTHNYRHPRALCDFLNTNVYGGLLTSCQKPPLYEIEETILVVKPEPVEKPTETNFNIFKGVSKLK